MNPEMHVCPYLKQHGQSIWAFKIKLEKISKNLNKKSYVGEGKWWS
jgi:hypothetical protein